MEPIEQLIYLFPNNSKNHIEATYNQTNNDLNKTIDILTREDEEVGGFQQCLNTIANCFLTLICCGDCTIDEDDRFYQNVELDRRETRNDEEVPIFQFHTNGPEIPKKADYYREEAKTHIEIRNKLHKQAKEFKILNNKTKEIECFKQIKKESRYIEECHHLAAIAFLKQNYEKEPRKDTLDVHHLYKREAVNALDIFVDEAINTCLESKTLHVITGAGKHSINNLPVLKPLIINRLNERNLRFEEKNDGCLIVYVYKTSKVTNDLLKEVPK